MSDMSKQTHLHKRGATYYFRAKVPADLRSAFGRAEEKYSLGTKNYHEAKRLARHASVEFDRKCSALRQQRRASSPVAAVLDGNTIQTVCNLWRYHTLAGDEHTRRCGLSEHEFEQQSSARRETSGLLKQALARGRVDLAEPALHQFLYLLNLQPTGDPDNWQQLRYEFLQTVAETHAQQIMRDAGESVKSPEPPAGTASAPAPGGCTLDEVFGHWKAFEANRPLKTVNDMERTIGEFKEVAGCKPARAVTREDVMKYRNHLVQVLHRKAKTVEKKITFLCALFNVGIHYGLLAANPASRIPKPKDDSDERLPFDLDDLRKIFTSPLYLKSERLGRDTGEAGVWLPMLSLFSGARQEELGQLLVSDVACVDGVWCLQITAGTEKADSMSGDKKRLKTRSSRRRLPLHPKVIQAGFLPYWQAMKDAGHTRLFPTLRPDRYGKLTSSFSKEFNSHLRKLGIIQREKVFHSFRHTFRDACREADLPEEIADAMMGHSPGKKTGRTYGRSFSISKLHEAICRIDYPGVTVPAIAASRPKHK